MYTFTPVPSSEKLYERAEPTAVRWSMRSSPHDKVPPPGPVVCGDVVTIFRAIASVNSGEVDVALTEACGNTTNIAVIAATRTATMRRITNESPASPPH